MFLHPLFKPPAQHLRTISGKCELIVWKWMCERGFRALRKKSGIVLSQRPESSLYPPNQSLGIISAVTSAGFPPANTANCVWRDTRCRRLKPQPRRRKASDYSTVKEDFWTHVLQPFHCGVSSCALMLFMEDHHDLWSCDCKLSLKDWTWPKVHLKSTVLALHFQSVTTV